METFAFQAEINQLLSLIINTFYSNKEIFLRVSELPARNAREFLEIAGASRGTHAVSEPLLCAGAHQQCFRCFGQDQVGVAERLDAAARQRPLGALLDLEFLPLPSHPAQLNTQLFLQHHDSMFRTSLQH